MNHTLIWFHLCSNHFWVHLLLSSPLELQLLMNYTKKNEAPKWTSVLAAIQTLISTKSCFLLQFQQFCTEPTTSNEQSFTLLAMERWNISECVLLEDTQWIRIVKLKSGSVRLNRRKLVAQPPNLKHKGPKREIVAQSYKGFLFLAIFRIQFTTYSSCPRRLV